MFLSLSIKHYFNITMFPPVELTYYTVPVMLGGDANITKK